MLLRGRSYYQSALSQRLLLSVVFASLSVGAVVALLHLSANNLSSTEANAALPKIISYQAKVTDASGVTVSNGSYLVKFAIYDAASSGNCLYVASGTCASPTAVTTTITSGAFSVLLGDTTAGFNTLTTSTLASSSIYIGVTIGSDSEMTPRKRLVATPYAMNTLTLNGLDAQTDGGTSSYIIAASSTGQLIITGTGTSTFSMGATFATSGGQVGIGTGTPQYKLDVNGDISASQGIRDGNAWIGNQSFTNNLALAYNNGGFGGGASPSKLVVTSTDVTTFNTTAINASSTGFTGAVFDGRYIYFISNDDDGNVVGNVIGNVTRYDTTREFSTTSSYTFFNVTKVNDKARGFQGGVFDGRYLYLMQYEDGVAYSSSGLIARYDTQSNFTATSSWEVATTAITGQINSYNGGVFDGRYVYFVPYFSTSGYSSKVVRYDPNLSFTSSAAWSMVDIFTVAGLCGGFNGATFDGRYIYFAPLRDTNHGCGELSGQVARYDTTGVFSSATSWSGFDMTSVSSTAKGYHGAIFDGRYVYFTPEPTMPAPIARYDTSAPFGQSSSWSFFAAGLVSPYATDFWGGVFDGRYIYFTPYSNRVLLVYDTTQPFTDPTSWFAGDTKELTGLVYYNFYQAAAFDGRYVYLADFEDQAISVGRVTRIRAYSGGINSHPSVNQTATTRDLYLDSRGQIGLGTTAPSSRLTVANGGIDIDSGVATTTVSSTYFISNKTAANASGTFYLDSSGNIFTSGSIQMHNKFVLDTSGNLSTSGSLRVLSTTVTSTFSYGVILASTSGSVGIGTTTPRAKLDAPDIITSALTFSRGTTLSSLSGFNSQLNLTNNLGIRDTTFAQASTILNPQVNLTNLGTIQAGGMKLRGGGTFATQVTYAVGAGVRFTVVGDLNGDGKNDLAATNATDATVSILINNGNGTFAAQVTYAVGTGPTDVVIGDLNGDGKNDLAVTNTSSATISVLINNGDGTFATQVTYAVGASPRKVAMGDLNGDGKNDLVITNATDATVSILINNGNGTFATQVTYAVGTSPRGVATGDLNGDGKNDLVVANNGATTASVLINNGDGTFAAQVTYTVGAGPFGVAMGDLNGDGKNDLAVANTTDATISVLLNIPTNLLVVDAFNGNVGLGTSSGTARLTVVNGGIDISSGVATTTVSSTFLAINKTTTNASGTFYINPSGNVYSSGTFAFLNNAFASSSIRGSGLVLTDPSVIQGVSAGFGLVIPGGYICVSASSSKCIPSGGGAYASGSIYAEAYRSTSAADVAENFSSAESLEPGDVVTFDLLHSEHIKKTTTANEPIIAGVISTKPGFILGSDGPQMYPLALTGRVPVKVTNENGPINIGDQLVASSRPGYAMKYVASSTQAGIIGIALQAMSADEMEGKIMVFLRGAFIPSSQASNLDQNNLNITSTNVDSVISYNQNLDLLNHSIFNVKSIAGLRWSITADGTLQVEKIETKELQIEKLTITSSNDETKTAGRGIIPAGARAVVVENANVGERSAIFINIHGKENIRWFIAEKSPRQSFTLELSEPQTSDVSFAYWVVEEGN